MVECNVPQHTIQYNIYRMDRLYLNIYMYKLKNVQVNKGDKPTQMNQYILWN